VRLYNTFSKSVESFSPLDASRVTMYSCGPTVYSFAHIGNFRSFLFADVLRRVLERRGFAVRQVMNITDVGHMTEDHLADAGGEDKLARAARELGSDPFAVAAHFEREFARDARALRLRVYQGAEADDRAVHPRATDHVPQMLAMIGRLLDRGYAYTDASGQVYFEISKFPGYGALSGKNIDELEEGARVAVREEKRDARDFALWKVDPIHLMQWDAGATDARIGTGFPGWHIECSAMSQALLGNTIDVHTGGEDNVFPHHECEIAQSCCADDITTPAPDGGPARTTFARYWVHGRHLLVNGRKMSKRDGTFYTARDLMSPHEENRPDLAAQLERVGLAGRVPAATLRLALMSVHYRMPMNFNFDLVVQAHGLVERMQAQVDRLRELAGDAPATPNAVVDDHVGRFDAALADDLDVPAALAVVTALVKQLNQELSPGGAAAALAALLGIDRVLDVLDHAPRSGRISRERIAELAAVVDPSELEALLAGELDVERLVAHRSAARTRKDFAAADRIRDHLKSSSVALEDLPDGVRWKR
jgi:cysteinyl-tRNA synthetase